jgi:DNA excision repair protein ERCC-2
MKVYFPFENVRSEQEKLVKDAVDCFEKGECLIVHAPTGLGKTVSSIAPAISYAIEQEKKVFFLTPKISQHEIALETVRLMNEKFDLDIKAIDLVGKKQMCLEPFISEMSVGFYEACSKKKEKGECLFYENARGSTPKKRIIAKRKREAFRGEYNRSYSSMKALCSTRDVCPYEITTSMIKDADVIIGDYSHLFSDDIREAVLGPSGVELSDVLVVVDEAHNLASRLRDMNAGQIDLIELEKAEKEAKSVGLFAAEMAVKQFKEEIISLGKKLSLGVYEAEATKEETSKLKAKCLSYSDVEEAALAFIAKNKVTGCFLMSTFEAMTSIMKADGSTLVAVERRGAGLRLSAYPMDVSIYSGKVLNNCFASMLMSGTMLPLDMYKDILGAKKYVLLEYESPFTKENRLNIIVPKTTTKYTQRNEAQFKEIGNSISGIANLVPGNVIAFFPSFELLEAIKPFIKSNKKVLFQSKEMDSSEKDEIIKEFKGLGSAFGSLLLAVSGGSIAEGVDFPGTHLLCAIVVGIPFGKTSIYSNALIRFYDALFGKGWDYGYNAPAFTKAIQAAGRVIRTETDRGVCVFLDERFAEPRYAKFFPKDFGAKTTLKPEELISEFFK